jgi:hypothetical protein
VSRRRPASRRPIAITWRVASGAARGAAECPPPPW